MAWCYRLCASVLLVAACSKPESPPESPPVIPEEKRLGCDTSMRGCDVEPGQCGAGDLPRLDEKAWGPEGSQRLLSASRRGSVVVEHRDGASRVLDTCKLDGKYTEVVGEPGSGRFWANNRTLFRPSELSEGCAAATHSVAAFAVATAGAFSAILIPLPCPSTADARPAEGCVGRGLTGPERLERAQKLRKRGSATSPVSEAFEAYALFSEDRTGRDFLHGLASRQDADCYMSGQVSAFGFQVEPPTIDFQRSWDECEYQPAYLGCFPGLFDPAPGEPHGCWRPVKP